MGDGTATSWEDFLSALAAIADQDRDGDGIVDKPLCIKLGCTNLRSLFMYIASSLIQRTGSSEADMFAPYDMQFLFNSPAWSKALEIFANLFEYVDVLP